MSPSVFTLAVGDSRTLTATVNGSTNTGVDWSASGGSVTPGGVYTAPETVGTYTITAHSVADPSKFGTSKVTVKTPSISVMPSRVELLQGGSAAFSASGSAAALGVTWSATGGTIDASGNYTAPSEIGTFIVQATGRGQTGSATVVVVNPSVTISPSSKKVLVSSQTTFSATISGISNRSVVWSAQRGVISASGVYTAPAVMGPDTVTVTCVAFGTIKATATIDVVNAGTVAVSPSDITLRYHYSAAQNEIVFDPVSVDFSATLSGDLAGTGVNWTLISASPYGYGGSLNSNGHYVPPIFSGEQDPVGLNGAIVTVKATSILDPTRSGTAKVHLVKSG